VHLAVIFVDMSRTANHHTKRQDDGDGTTKNGSASSGADFLDACGLSLSDMRRLAHGSAQEREQVCVPVSQVTSAHVSRLQPLSFFEHLACVLFLSFAVPNGVFSIPLVTYLIGRFLLGNVTRAFQGLALLLLPLIILPQAFVPSTLQSWMAAQVLKYFSFRFVLEQRPPTHKPHEEKLKPSSSASSSRPRPQILVAPPHGVFPYGNILAMISWPLLTGHHFIGLAANSALRVPIFKQILRSIGVVDASRSTARKSLETFPYTIGISTGGVAEVFSTNAADECIILQQRVGLVKLAIRTGADLVPCYLFGNTKLLSCWAGEGIPGLHGLLEKVSRKIGFATILFFGRWGLPIPYRIPILGVMGKPIPTIQYECVQEPSPEQIARIQQQLIDEMTALFDRHKALYGWDDKRLIIK